jgi:hypothetical protein
MTFRVASAGTTGSPAAEAVGSAIEEVMGRLGGGADLLLVGASAEYELDEVIAATRRTGVSAVHGLTSCLGAMSDRALHSRDGVGMAVLGIRDENGAYGSGLAHFDGDPEAAGHSAVLDALRTAGRPGEVPRLILVAATPGHEERVLAGIQSVVGPHVPILGGSAADNDVAGRWRVWSARGESGAGVVVSVLFTSVEVAYSFKSGYEPTGHEGVITRAEGRSLFEIDGEPAARVYDRWTGGRISSFLGEGGNILGLTALDPIGRPVRSSEGLTYYRLAHPEAVTDGDALALFAEIEEGATVVSMGGSLDSLVARGAQVVERALRRGRLTPKDTSGALVTYCGGCMLALGDRVPEMAARIPDVVPGVPCVGLFTFGEQGKFVGGANLHSNLMISAIVFGR